MRATRLSRTTGLASLKNLKSLTELDLYGARITDAGLVYLAALTGLTKLNLLGAAVTDAGLQHLARLRNLRELNLYRTKITNTGVERLKELRGLRSLDLRYTRVTAAGIAALRSSLPECRISYIDVSVRPVNARSGPPPANVAAWVRSRGGKSKWGHGVIREISLAATATSDKDMERLRGCGHCSALT